MQLQNKVATPPQPGPATQTSSQNSTLINLYLHGPWFYGLDLPGWDCVTRNDVFGRFVVWTTFIHMVEIIHLEAACSDTFQRNKYFSKMEIILTHSPLPYTVSGVLVTAQSAVPFSVLKKHFPIALRLWVNLSTGNPLPNLINLIDVVLITSFIFLWKSYKLLFFAMPSRMVFIQFIVVIVDISY